MAGGDRSVRISVAVDEGHCVHAHSVWAICARCVNACPGGAISLPQGAKAPVVDEQRCVSCGQCLSACSLGAFSSPEFSERRLLERIEKEGSIRLRCFLPYGELESLAQDGGSYHVCTCLAALSPGVLYQMATERSCELVTDRCRECVLFAKVEAGMRRNFEDARALLSDCGRAHHLWESSPLFLPKRVNDSDSNEVDDDATVCAPAPNVRAVFHSIFVSVRDNPPVKRKPLPLRALRKHVPEWRASLGEVWNMTSHVSHDGAYLWPVHVVDRNRCRACGMCMQLCPTGTIAHGFGDGRFRYSFTPGNCAECGLCFMSCPVAAISRERATNAAPFDEVECFECEAEPCPRCGLPNFASRGEPVCRLCQKRLGT
ncbi:4Fe-4S dicluster domain-containing protein [Denitrobacterium detoxificans]|uniref:4Fe-4S dicluster domain-containing protein n=1 Tax=Denitrobacterium detoxificans TaxID=79604 RepID=A0A1H8U124_9ACTN|nr:4Fe-4S dicluster domain-containing protein [Denitrobacterium detoxificans]SEO96564.1 4Fe-4S dicluster domain-containing protein [Denitrobacterium detoxificans]